MAHAQDTSPTAFLHRLFPPADIQAAAGQVGFVKRRRKIEPVAFLVATVLTVCGRGEESLAAMRRSLASRTGVLMARSAFWDRWTPAFEALVTWLLGRLQATSAASPPEYPGWLRGFKDVIAQHSTVVQADSRLKKLWPGTRKSSAPAAIKAHGTTPAGSADGSVPTPRARRGRGPVCLRPHQPHHRPRPERPWRTAKPRAGPGLTPARPGTGRSLLGLLSRPKDGIWKTNFQENTLIPGWGQRVEVENIHMTILDTEVP